MSSILKALQKLESETLEKGAGRSWLHHFTARQRAPEKQGGLRGKYILALLCSVLIISGSAALIFMKTKPASLTPELQPVQGAENLSKDNAPAPAVLSSEKTMGAAGTDKIAAKSGRVPESGTTAGDSALLNRTAQAGLNREDVPDSASAEGPAVFIDTKKSDHGYPEKSSGPDAREARAVATAGHKQIEPSSEPLETPETALQSGAVESPHTALNANREESGLNTGPETLDESQNSISAKRLQTPDIKLHAISWTPDVKTRIAVINGSIVREGDTVSSYRVYKINKDDVVLSEGGEFWRLAFRGR